MTLRVRCHRIVEGATPKAWVGVTFCDAFVWASYRYGEVTVRVQRQRHGYRLGEVVARVRAEFHPSGCICTLEELMGATASVLDWTASVPVQWRSRSMFDLWREGDDMLRFAGGPEDLMSAAASWGANCGPGSLAAALGWNLADVREHVCQPPGQIRSKSRPSVDGEFRGFMTITDMKRAIRSAATLGTTWSDPGPDIQGLLEGPHPIIVCVAWDGPWSRMPRVAATFRHFIACRPLGDWAESEAYDVNYGCWIPLTSWLELVTGLYPSRATGWSVKWAGEVVRRRP